LCFIALCTDTTQWKKSHDLQRLGKKSLFQSFHSYYQMEVLRVNVTKFSFSSNLTEEINTCDSIDFHYNYLNYDKDTWIIMQQYLEKDLKIVISKLTHSNIKNIFKLTLLKEVKFLWILYPLELLMNTIVTMVWKYIGQKTPYAIFVVLETRNHCIHSIKYWNNQPTKMNYRSHNAIQ
jgi:hypothetical protein